MDDKVNRIAALANISAFNEEVTQKYIGDAPHLNHASLRQLYLDLLAGVYRFAGKYSTAPKVLDLGAGEGTATLPFLEYGARVTAVDSSVSQLNVLRSKCAQYAGKLEVCCEDINERLRVKTEKYDIIVFSSFLHHVPDYIGMISEAATLLPVHGQLFTFQDPLRYDSAGRFTMMFTNLAYFSWRIGQGDVLEGIKRRFRRSRGVYLADSIYDNSDYHVTRNGVDQEAICRLLKEQGFNCDIVSYFSTQSRLFQIIGTMLGLKNTFALVARRQSALVSKQLQSPGESAKPVGFPASAPMPDSEDAQ